MKLQNLIIIFIIIIIPIVSIFALYLNLETKTIVLQTDYDEKLIEATKEAMSAFEINTTEWNNEYSSLANSKRQDVLSSVNVFTISLADKLRIGGTSKESILSYVPAIVFTMYDGYYIYAPTYVPQTITDDKGVQLFYYSTAGVEGAKYTALATQNIGGTILPGEPMYYFDSSIDGAMATGTYNGIAFTTKIEYAEKTYKHILKTFIPYTIQKNYNGNDYIINYTLDNYVRIYGAEDSVVDKTMEGYIIEDYGNTNKIEIPVKSISGVKYNGLEIRTEELTESIYVIENGTPEAELKEYPYIYNSSNDKRYYDATADKFFTLNSKNERKDLPEAEIGGTLAEYKKVLIRSSDTSDAYLELYQLLNGSDINWYYKVSDNHYLKYDEYQPVINKGMDCSAINYYVETYFFNEWITGINGLNLDETEIQSMIDGRRQAIINNINNNLNLSISNYSANSRIEYEIPELLDADWEQALSNISMITFFQGAKVGLKTYNNYAIVTSTGNNEFVSEDSLYFIGETSDNYYHRYYCNKGNPSTFEAYKNTEFKARTYKTENETVKYYHKHYGTSGELQECFDCIVNRNNYKETTDSGNINSYNSTFYNAIARERYVLIQRTRLTQRNAEHI